MRDLELTILMPCLNEAETLATCIRKARGFLERTGIAGEVLIADNGSTDGSREIAVAAGARVVEVGQKGYGAALSGGIAAARGRYVIMGDADDSYDFANLDALRRAPAGRRPAGHGQPLQGRHRARRDALAPQVYRQPGAELPRPAVLQGRGRRISIAGCAASTARRSSGSTCAPPAWSSPPRWW